MRITVNPATLTSTMGIVSSVLADKLTKEELKNLIFKYEHETQSLYLCGFNLNVITFTDVSDASVEFVEGEVPGDFMIQVKAKDVNDVLGLLKGLKVTKVAGIWFNVNATQTDVIMTVSEEPIDEMRENAEQYYKEVDYRIRPVKLAPRVSSDIMTCDRSHTGVAISKIDLATYLSVLLPTVVNETKEGMNAIVFNDTHVYTIPASYAATMPNTLPDELKGFSLRNNIASFLKDFIAIDDSVSVHKAVMGKAVSLTVRAGNSVAVLTVPDNSKALDITRYLTPPSNGVVLDRGYLSDVVRRARFSNTDASFLEINVEEGTAHISSKSMSQDIPVEGAKGLGVYRFNLRNELMYFLTGMHVDLGTQVGNVFLYLTENERGKIEIACGDNTKSWLNMMLNIEPATGGHGW